MQLASPLWPHVTASIRARLESQAVDWAVAHGLTSYSKDPKDASRMILSHAAMSLLPSPLPRFAFERARYLQPLFNALVHRVALHPTFLSSVCDELIDADDFTGKLYEIHACAKAEPIRQKISLGIHRSDYMLHTCDAGYLLQQVELNTISASFSSLTHLVGDMQRYLIRNMGLAEDVTCRMLCNMPSNTSFTSFADGLARAHKLYGEPRAVVMMIVQPGEQNAFDQRWIEYNLGSRHDVRLIRRTLAEIGERATYVGEHRKLFIDELEVSVAYYRAGYAPKDYPTELEWKARKLVELSFAIKCPTAAYQLAGMKKVQQILSDEETLRQFFPENAAIVDALKSCFTGLYPLGSPRDDELMGRVTASPEGFVLKPQREGGGNNFYGAEAAAKLRELSEHDRKAYILMDRIRPPTSRGLFMRQNCLHEFDAVSELGIYGVFLGDEETVFFNEAAGHLVRTKGSTVNEGGVAAGYAYLDSPLLVDTV